MNKQAESGIPAAYSTHESLCSVVPCPDVKDISGERGFAGQVGRGELWGLTRGKTRSWGGTTPAAGNQSGRRDLGVLVGAMLSMSQPCALLAKATTGRRTASWPRGLPTAQHWWDINSAVASVGLPVRDQHGCTGGSPAMVKGLEHLTYEKRPRELEQFSLEGGLGGALPTCLATWQRKDIKNTCWWSLSDKWQRQDSLVPE